MEPAANLEKNTPTTPPESSVAEEAPTIPSKNSWGKQFRRAVRYLISGNFLTRKEFQSHIPYIFFVTLLAILYIYNGFYMNGLHRQISTLSKEVKELRFQSMTLKAMRVTALRRSSIVEQVQKRGIEVEEAVEPPIIITR